MKTILSLLLLFACSTVSFSQDSKPCHLVVKVENIKKEKGRMMFAVYNHHDKFLKDALTHGKAEIHGTTAYITFEGLEEGIYAVSIFQDENDNGKLDTNFIGIPSEPYAFSNDAKGMFGPPDFKDCQFELKKGEREIVITL